MEERTVSRATTRRRFLLGSAMVAGAALTAACAPAAPPTATPAPAAKPAAAAPTAAPAAKPAATAPTAAPAAKPAAAAPTAAPAAAKPAAQPAAGAVKQAPRNRTLILMWAGTEGKYVDHDIWNGYSVGSNHQNGLGLLHEPVSYYSSFADKMVPWLVESYKYSPDFKELVMKTRSGVQWSDGKPFSAEDVAYTIESLRKAGAKYKWGANLQQHGVASAVATDANTVQVKFDRPAPKFFYFMTYKFDIGVYPIPKHIFEKSEDWTQFKNLDIAAGLPVTTGPWQVAFTSPDQKILDRRDKWWAAASGLAQMPKVERIIYLPNTGETQMAQAHIANQIDSSLDLRPNTMKTVVAQNAKIITHSGRELPFGYVDWWPTSLWVNHEKPPFDKKEVRWALSYFIDRKQVVDVGYGGAGSVSVLPIPSYPPLKPFADAVKPQLQKWDTVKFDPAEGAKLLEGAGFKKNGAGLWADAQGNTIKMPIIGWTIFADIGPVVAEQLKRQGIDATFSMPPDASQQFTGGTYIAAFNGHGGSVSGDPYFTLSLYKSNLSQVAGSHQANFARWKNTDFDKIVDEMGAVPMEDQAKLIDLWKKAMDLWLPELPDIQITEWYHRIPMNTTYWKGWPTKDDAYVNGAFWHLTFQMILNKLEPAQ
jgi:peptide/nickel transport system substrate-binding protein